MAKLNGSKIEMKNKKVLAVSYLCVFAAIVLDQFTKYLAAVRLKGNDAFVLIPGVFEFRYLENTSAAFSLDPVSILHKILHISYFDAHPDAFLMSKMIFFAVLTIAVVVLLVILYNRIPWERHWLPGNLIVLAYIAGAVGNLIDRIVHHYVIDFFYFKLIDFPVFNVADIYVTVAAFSMVLCILFVYREEDFALIFPSEKE